VFHARQGGKCFMQDLRKSKGVYENAKEIEIFYGASLNIAVLLWKQILKE
jgi:hypothetical protein